MGGLHTKGGSEKRGICEGRQPEKTRQKVPKRNANERDSTIRKGPEVRNAHNIPESKGSSNLAKAALRDENIAKTSKNPTGKASPHRQSRKQKSLEAGKQRSGTPGQKGRNCTRQ